MMETPLPDLLVLLAAAVAIVAGFRTIRLSPVLGYLVAGMVIGPGGLKLVQNVDHMDGIADFGIVFLLFMIGLDLSWDKLKAMRSQVLLIGTCQVALTAAAFALAAHVLGLEWMAGSIVGCGLALSSTALVVSGADGAGITGAGNGGCGGPCSAGRLWQYGAVDRGVPDDGENSVRRARYESA